jgi:hypothetical protein
MARLRIRIELNRGGAGVPLYKLASVVDEARRFFEMLARDVHVDQSKGEWLGFDFDHESLNFTAEFTGPVTAEQVAAFHAAFDGTTSLQRATIAQFARITNAIDEDELIGFGLYLNDNAREPDEWRCLTRRDALRIAEEIQTLLQATGEGEGDSHLPAVVNPGVSRLFSERRDRGEPARLAAYVREMEANLDQRISRVERAIDVQSEMIAGLHSKSSATEESVQKLLGAVETFCAQTTRQLEMISPPAVAAAASASGAATPALAAPASVPSTIAAPQPAATPAAPPSTVPVPEPDPRNWPVTLAPKPRYANLWVLTAAGVLIGAATVALVTWSWQVQPASATAPLAANGARPAPTPAGSAKELSVPPPPIAGTPAPSAAPLAPAPSAAQASAQAAVPAPAPAAQDSNPRNNVPQASAAAAHLTLEASDSTWVSIRGADGKVSLARLFSAGETREVDAPDGSIIRVGNAGGLKLKVNGTEIPDLGPTGAIRQVQIKGGAYRILPPEPVRATPAPDGAPPAATEKAPEQ